MTCRIVSDVERYFDSSVVEFSRDEMIVAIVQDYASPEVSIVLEITSKCSLRVRRPQDQSNVSVLDFPRL